VVSSVDGHTWYICIPSVSAERKIIIYNELVWCCVLDNDVSSDNTLSSNAGNDAQAEVVADEDPRNKRFLFNLGGGSGGGSGNFLFDLIRVSVIKYIYTRRSICSSYNVCTLPTLFFSFPVLLRNLENTTNF